MHDVSVTSAPRPWNRLTTIAFVAFVLGMLASLPFLVHPFFEAGDDTNDAAMYIACTKSLLAGEGYAYLGQAFTIRPPGFSVLIAPLIALRGVDFFTLNVFVSLCGVLACALLFLWARPRLGTALAMAVAAALFLNPTFQTFSNRVMSDVPGATCLFACLLLARRSEKRPGIGMDILLGLAIAASAYVRSISVLLIPAILVARTFHRWKSDGWVGFGTFVRRRLVTLVLVPMLALLPWSLRNGAVAPEPPVDQNYIISYSTAMWHVDGGDPSSPRRPLSQFVERIPKRVEQSLTLVGSGLATRTPAPVPVTLGIVGLISILITLFRRRSAAEVFALGVCPVLLLYFGFKPRLVLPLFLIALPATADAAAWVLGRWTGMRVARGTLAVGFAALALTSLDVRSRHAHIEQVHDLYQATCAGFEANLAPDAVVASPVGWHYSVYLDRPVFSLFFAVRRAGHDMQAAEGIIDKYGINTVALAPRVPADRAMLPYFQERYGATMLRSGESFVFRVRP
jgi:hypothetical protein